MAVRRVEFAARRAEFSEINCFINVGRDRGKRRKEHKNVHRRQSILHTIGNNREKIEM